MEKDTKGTYWNRQYKGADNGSGRQSVQTDYRPFNQEFSRDRIIFPQPAFKALGARIKTFLIFYTMFNFLRGSQPHKKHTKKEIITNLLCSGDWFTYDDICDGVLAKYPYMKTWKWSYLKNYMKAIERDARKMAEKGTLQKSYIEINAVFRIDLPIPDKELYKLNPIRLVNYRIKYS